MEYLDANVLLAYISSEADRVGLVGDRPGVGRLGGALGGVGAEAEASAVGGDDADSIAARGEAVDPASSPSFAWHGLLREGRAAMAAGGEGPSCGRRQMAAGSALKLL